MPRLEFSRHSAPRSEGLPAIRADLDAGWRRSQGVLGLLDSLDGTMGTARFLEPILRAGRRERTVTSPTSWAPYVGQILLAVLYMRTARAYMMSGLSAASNAFVSSTQLGLKSSV